MEIVSYLTRRYSHPRTTRAAGTARGRSRPERVEADAIWSANATSEPSLDDLLSDPIMWALMRADRVVAEDVIAVVERLRA